jgi:hypothetical protein
MLYGRRPVTPSRPNRTLIWIKPCRTQHLLRREKARPFSVRGWGGNHIGFYPFPTIADEMREEHRRRVLGE